MTAQTTSAAENSISSSFAKRALLAFFVIGLVLRIWVGVALPRIAHIDEILQTEEPAHYLAYGYGLFTWEWREGIRSWVFPAFLAAVMRATDWMGAGSSGYLLGIKLVLSLLSLTTVGVSYAFARRESGNEAAVIAAGCCALWFSLIDFAPRALTEAVSAHLLLPALYLGIYAEKIDERKRMLAAGLLCGLAACLRIQYAPAIGFALLYFCFHRPGWKNRMLPLALGVLLPVAIFGLADALTWSYPFSSFVRYFEINMLQGRAAQFGVLPWYWYLASGLPQALGPLPVFALFGIRRSPFLSWLAAILLVTHSLIPHKEMRFLYALWPILITLAAMGTVEIARAINARLRRPLLSPRIVVATSVSFSALVLAGVLIGYHFLGRFQGDMVQFDQLSRDPNLCGVALVNFYRLESGGYTHLHQDVPILHLRNEVAMRQSAGSFNALISGRGMIETPEGFALKSCRYGSCLYERQGDCAPLAGNEYAAGPTLRRKQR